MHNAPPVAAPARRDRLVILTCLFVITVVAWAYLFHLDRQMSAAMAHDSMMAEMGMTLDVPWSAAEFFFTFVMWTVMMVGMMAASAAPVLLLFAAARARRPDGGRRLAVCLFGLGYVAVWTLFSGAAATAQWALREAAMLSPAMAAASPRLAGAILIAAGAYQLTPLKGACLKHCRSPLGFLMSNWREGHPGAFRMGLTHGTYCVACCWALMCVLFVVGVMNLAWVAALSAFVLAEKIGPAAAGVARTAGAAMIVAGALYVAGVL